MKELALVSELNSVPAGLRRFGAGVWIAALLLLFFCAELQAEPYLAMRTGHKCMSCHVNPAGGGKRTAFGQIYGQTVMPTKPSTKPLLDAISSYLDLGADLRGRLTVDSVRHDEDRLAFSTDRASVYLEASVVPDRVTLYLDQRFAPGSSNREAWLLYRHGDKQSFVQAGSFFLPYGLRIEDDAAFIRERTGMNFNNADNGVMLGHDKGGWSGRLSLTNGTNGGSESNRDKQLTARIAHIKPRWRAGVSASANPGSGGYSRYMANIFGGLRFLDVEWLAEMDVVTDEAPDEDDTTQLMTYLGATKELARGHNLMGSFEWLDPDNSVDEDYQTRTSLIWEYTPLPLFQIRTGAIYRKGIPQSSEQNIRSLFTQFHVWF